jgi:hypothetical protein
MAWESSLLKLVVSKGYFKAMRKSKVVRSTLVESIEDNTKITKNRVLESSSGRMESIT